MNLIPLELMAVGEVGQIAQVEGPSDVVHRLAEMGLREKAGIRMIQPGRPCIIAIDNHRISLRADDEVEVLVALANRV